MTHPMVTRQLPTWHRILAVVAHPDDESFGLGGVLAAFAATGAELAVLCLTHGEASTLHGVAGDLDAIRSRELAEAAGILGGATVTLLDEPDGGLSRVDPERLRGHVLDAVARHRPEGLVVFDDHGVTGHPDHVRATVAAVEVATRLGLPVLAWTLPAEVATQLNAEFGVAFAGRAAEQVDLVVPVDRERQRRAIAAHASQAVPGSVLWRRLELLGGVERLRWLRPAGEPAGTATPAPGTAGLTTPAVAGSGAPGRSR